VNEESKGALLGKTHSSGSLQSIRRLCGSLGTVLSVLYML